ncbi:hypothetical protein AC786_02810 [Helicobacter pylori]|nr:hypothetical protein AC786_02810 [Helicobacter pylori]
MQTLKNKAFRVSIQWNALVISMQTLKNKAFRVSIQWNALVRKLLSLERGGFTLWQRGRKAGKKAKTIKPPFCVYF